MYEDGGHMTEMVDLLKGVKTKEEFKTAIMKFDKDNFNYQAEKGDYFGFNDRKFSFYSELGGCVDFSRDYFTYFFSDYTYFLNLSGEEVEFRLKDGGGVYLQNNKIAIFNFGNFYKPETIDLFDNVIEKEEETTKHTFEGMEKLLLQVEADAFNDGFGKKIRRVIFCKETEEWTIQQKTREGWLYLHN